MLLSLERAENQNTYQDLMLWLHYEQPTMWDAPVDDKTRIKIGLACYDATGVQPSLYPKSMQLQRCISFMIFVFPKDYEDPSLRGKANKRNVIAFVCMLPCLSAGHETNHHIHESWQPTSSHLHILVALGFTRKNLPDFTISGNSCLPEPRENGTLRLTRVSATHVCSTDPGRLIAWGCRWSLTSSGESNSLPMQGFRDVPTWHSACARWSSQRLPQTGRQS